MRKFLAIIMFSGVLLANEMIVKVSDYSVDETIANIKKIVESKGFSVFAVIDHKQNASKVGMELAQAQVIIFGNPKMGTRLMQDEIRIALDLPLRVLVYRDQDEKVKIAYRNGTWIKKEHDLDSDALTVKVDAGMNKITDKARIKVN